MSRTKRIAVTLLIVAAGSVGLVGVASADDYNNSVDVAGLHLGGVVHTVVHVVNGLL
jgi:hypothetical protein